MYYVCLANILHYYLIVERPSTDLGLSYNHLLYKYIIILTSLSKPIVFIYYDENLIFPNKTETVHIFFTFPAIGCILCLLPYPKLMCLMVFYDCRTTVCLFLFLFSKPSKLCCYINHLLHILG